MLLFFEALNVLPYELNMIDKLKTIVSDYSFKSISNGKGPFGVPKVINGTLNSILEPQMEPIVFYHSNHSLQISIYFNIWGYQRL